MEASMFCLYMHGAPIYSCIKFWIWIFSIWNNRISVLDLKKKTIHCQQLFKWEKGLEDRTFFSQCLGPQLITSKWAINAWRVKKPQWKVKWLAQLFQRYFSSRTGTSQHLSFLPNNSLRMSTFFFNNGWIPLYFLRDCNLHGKNYQASNIEPIHVVPRFVFKAPNILSVVQLHLHDWEPGNLHTLVS